MPTEAAPRRAVILAVDDTPLNLDTLTELLRDEYTVRPALNGEIALRLARGNTAPDLILLDVMMPEMDGYEVLRRLRADPETADIPVIFITALAHFSDESRALALGAADYITKPFSPPVVLARVRTQLALQQARRRLQAANARRLAERELIEDVLTRLRETESFDARQLRYHLSSVDRSNGDILLAAFTPDGGQRLLAGDIAGHGPAAAACAPLLGHLFYTACAEGHSARALLDTLGSVLFRRLPAQIFLVFALVEIAAGRRHATVWNGGLPGCVVLRPQAPPVHLGSRSLPLGLQAAGPAADEGVFVELAAGDRLCLFSDGVSEIANTAGEALGEEAAARMLQQCGGDPDAFVAALVGYQGHDRFRDDLTIAALEI